MAPSDLLNFQANFAQDYFNKYGSNLPGDVILRFRSIADYAESGGGTTTADVRIGSILVLGGSQPDGVGDVCDNCPNVYNPTLADGDNDGVGDACDACPGTAAGATVDVDGCVPVIPADFDNDGDVDSDDVDAFKACASGPAIPFAPGCDDKDFDSDNDTDQSDFAIVQRCLSGANNLGDPTCAD